MYRFCKLNLHLIKEYPREIIVSMAILETGYGKSRFAIQGNNLFGIRTWNKDLAQLKPKDNRDVEWGVKTYITQCLPSL